MHREERIMRLYSSIGVADIWTRTKYPYRRLPENIFGLQQIKTCIFGLELTKGNYGDLTTFLCNTKTLKYKCIYRKHYSRKGATIF